MLAGVAIQALQRLAASNPKLYKALLGMKKDSRGRISTTTLAQVSMLSKGSTLHVLLLSCKTSACFVTTSTQTCQ